MFSFHSLAQYIESPDVEKEVKRLLSTDAEAVSVRILLGGKKSSSGGWDTMCDLEVVERRHKFSFGCERLGDKQMRHRSFGPSFLPFSKLIVFS